MIFALIWETVLFGTISSNIMCWYNYCVLYPDILNIQSWPKELNDLSVFSSLTTIQGRSFQK